MISAGITIANLHETLQRQHNWDQCLNKVFIWVRYCMGGGGFVPPATIRTMRPTSTPTALSTTTTTMSTILPVRSAPPSFVCQKFVRANGDQCLGKERNIAPFRRGQLASSASPRKNMPTEAGTAGETDCLSICLWSAGFCLVRPGLQTPSGDFLKFLVG